MIRTRLRGEWHARPVHILGYRLVDFPEVPGYRLSDWEAGLFAHRHWKWLEAGLRADWQEASGATRLAPRVAASWPLSARTVLRAGFGLFHDRVPLNVYAFPHLLAERDFSPRSATFSAQLEHRFLRATWTEGRSRGLIVLLPEAGLRDSGRSRQGQLEIVARLRWEPEAEIVLSYVHSRVRANLNDFTGFLGDFPSPLVRPDAYTEASGNIPHRFLAWGVMPLDYGLRVAPMMEWRTGFPYAAVDAAQNYVGLPNTRRFPPFFSLDLRISKDIEVKKHAVRLAFSIFNLTNHWNPDTVRRNTADRLFGQFLGQHKRRWRLDLDILR